MITAQQTQSFIKKLTRHFRIGILLEIGLWIYVILCVCFLLLREVAFPIVAEKRDAIVAVLSEALHAPIKIDSLRLAWPGLHPQLHFTNLKILDQQGRVALLLPKVDAEVAWSSLLRARLELHRLEIEQPELFIQRDRQGKLFVAGIPIDFDDERSGFLDFILSQHQIRIFNARVQWQDDLRASPALIFDKTNLRLVNGWRHHRLAILTQPELANFSQIDLRADLTRTKRKWSGKVFIDAPHLNFIALQPWFDYPWQLKRGHGGLRAWTQLDTNHIRQLDTALDIADLQAQWGKDLPTFDLVYLQGLFSFHGFNKPLANTLLPTLYELQARQLTLATRDGLTIPPTHFKIRQSSIQNSIELNQANLDIFTRFARFFPLPAAIQTWLENPIHGEIKDFKLSVDRQFLQDHLNPPADRPLHPLRFTLSSSFKQLSMAPYMQLPGVNNLSGWIEGNEHNGKFQFSMQDGKVDLPRVMHESSIALQTAEINGKWQQKNNQLDLNLHHVKLENTDAHLEGEIRYTTLARGPGLLEVDMKGDRLNAAAAGRYMPLVVHSEVGAWLKQGVLAGQGSDARVKIKGDLHNFPFVDKKLGIFDISAKFKQGTVHIAPNWPNFTEVAGEIHFNAVSMALNIDSAAYKEVLLKPVKLTLPDFRSYDERLIVNGQAQGASPVFLDYLQASPLTETLGPVARFIHPQGNGQLSLALNIPLRHLDDITVQGNYSFVNNKVQLSAGIPPFENAQGQVAFTAHEVSLRDVSANFLGSRYVIRGSTQQDGSLHFATQGNLRMASILDMANMPSLAPYISGQTNVAAELNIRMPIAQSAAIVTFDAKSDLQGVELQLPAPFKKAANTSLPAQLHWQSGNPASPAPQTDALQIHLGNWLQAKIETHEQAGSNELMRGTIGISANPNAEVHVPPLPDTGLVVALDIPELNTRRWQALSTHISESRANSEKTSKAQNRDSNLLERTQFNLNTDRLVLGSYAFKNVALQAKYAASQWRLRFDGPDLLGNVVWVSDSNPSNPQNQDRLSARLGRLALHETHDTAVQEPSDPQLEKLPALDIEAERFSLEQRELGKLKLRATHTAQNWQLEHLELTNPNSIFTGKGEWTSGASSKLDFKLLSASGGDVLQRLGYPNAMQKGRVNLGGSISWHGPPTSLDFASMNGHLTLQVLEGQFNKLDPGVGRLLGILSLQALPRRITLDFRDVFSEGFVFDSIQGDIAIEKGVANTQNFQIVGPAARIFMRGSANLWAETQDLQVGVQPALSSGITLGATAINPVVGIATYVAQKMLKDPFEKLFAYNYRITGTWADPVVEKGRNNAREQNDQAN